MRRQNKIELGDEKEEGILRPKYQVQDTKGEETQLPLPVKQFCCSRTVSQAVGVVFLPL